MEKRPSTMKLLSRVIFLYLLFYSVLFGASHQMTRAIVKKGELTLFFSDTFHKKNIKTFTLQNPYRVIYDFKNTHIAHKRVPLGLGKSVKLAQNTKDRVRVVIYAKEGFHPIAYQPLFERKEYRISLPSQSQQSTTQATYSSRSVGSKISLNTSSHSNELIVIDAGHGGHDTGAIGNNKKEKVLVLQIAKRLEKELKKRGYPVYMTRQSDIFLKLHQRTKIADKKNATLFISIHANSVPKSKRYKVQGIETFFLQKTRDAKSQRIAERENKSVLKGTSRLSKSVILDSVLSGPKIVESNKLAIDVQSGMISMLRTRYKGVKDSGVRHAPFWVLVGASRPSILVEVGYISHPTERKRLFTIRYQSLLVKGMAQGIDSYLNNRKKELD